MIRPPFPCTRCLAPPDLVRAREHELFRALYTQPSDPSGTPRRAWLCTYCFMHDERGERAGGRVTPRAEVVEAMAELRELLERPALAPDAVFIVKRLPGFVSVPDLTKEQRDAFWDALLGHGEEA